MIADIMTKPLNTQLFSKFTRMLGLYPNEEWINGIKGKSRREGVLDLESALTHDDPSEVSRPRHRELGARARRSTSSGIPCVSDDWLRGNDTSEGPQFRSIKH